MKKEKLRERRRGMTEALKEKLREAFQSVFPIALIVLGLSVIVTPLESGTFLLFALGVLLLIVGTALFTLGADMSMLVIGQKVGSSLTKSKKIWLIALVSFVIGVIVTIAEPDLQILAEQVPDIDNMVMIISVSVGVGIFLAIAMLRIVPGLRLAAPRDAARLTEELREAVDVTDGPTVLRFPRGGVGSDIPALRRLDDGVDVLREASAEKSAADVLIVSVGPFAVQAEAVAERLA